MAFMNTASCSPTPAWPKSAGLPPYSAHVDALNWYRPQCPLAFHTSGLPPDSRSTTQAPNAPPGHGPLGAAPDGAGGAGAAGAGAAAGAGSGADCARTRAVLACLGW